MYQMKPNSKEPLSWITQSVNPRVLRIQLLFIPQEQKRENISTETFVRLQSNIKKFVTWKGIETLSDLMQYTKTYFYSDLQVNDEYVKELENRPRGMFSYNWFWLLQPNQQPD